MTEKQPSSPMLTDLLRLRETLARMRVRTRLFTLSVVLAVFAAIINLYVLQAVMSLSDGLVRGNFDFVRRAAGLGKIVAGHPQWFRNSWSLFLLLLAALYGGSLLKNLFSFSSSVLLARLTAASSAQIRRLIFRRYLAFGKRYLDQVGTARLHHVLMKFSGEVSEQLAALHRAVKQLLLLGVYVYLMFKISVALTLLLAAVASVFHAGLHRLIAFTRQTSSRMAQVQLELSQRVLNLIACLTLVKSYAHEKAEEARFNDLSEREIATSLRLSRDHHWQPCLEELMLMTVLVIVAAAIGWLVRSDPAFRIGNTFMFLYLVKSSIPTFGGLQAYRLAVARAHGPLSALEEMMQDADKAFVTSGDARWDGLHREIRVRNLTFAYGEGGATLHDLSCVMEQGKFTAIVGSTGAGKSTLAHLLMRFHDCPPDSIMLDDRDIRQFALPSLMTGLALVSQETVFFQDTIRRNLCYGLEREVTDAELEAACEVTGILPRLRRLPAGFDVVIGDRGVNFSGGEKQQLAIARALLKDTEILILDEATSALDARTEALVLKAIAARYRGRTLIHITHRLATVSSADHLIVLERGTVVESGPPAELIANQGRFFDYWQTQQAGLRIRPAA